VELKEKVPATEKKVVRAPMMDRKEVLESKKHYWYLRTVKEIAAEMDISESKVKMTLLRCRNELKKALEKEGVPV